MRLRTIPGNDKNTDRNDNAEQFSIEIKQAVIMKADRPGLKHRMRIPHTRRV
jgi:hypothetical protein